jgi:Holliday junction resolvase
VLESTIKTKIRNYLKKEINGYFIPYNPHYGKSGVPDIIGHFLGRFIGIEVKTEKGKLSKLQEHEIRAINSTGGYAIVVYGYEDFLTKFREVKELILNPIKVKEV